MTGEPLGCASEVGFQVTPAIEDPLAGLHIGGRTMLPTPTRQPAWRKAGINCGDILRGEKLLVLGGNLLFSIRGNRLSRDLIGGGRDQIVRGNASL